MRHMVMVFLTTMAVSSCDNLFYHDIDPVDPAPVVNNIIPPDKATGVPINTSIVISFSKKMNLSTINKESIIIKKIIKSIINGKETIIEEFVNGNVKADNNGIYKAQFTLQDADFFDPFQEYTITIRRPIRSLSGKKLEDEVVTRFTTGGDKDLSPPELVYVSPEYVVEKKNKLGKVDIYLYFSELIMLDFLNNSNISVSRMDGEEPRSIDGNFSYRFLVDSRQSNLIIIELDFYNIFNTPGNYQLTFSPDDPIKDTAGNKLSGPFYHTFRHLTRYNSPMETDCWLSGEDSECGQ
ncbi:MAG TPA: Ig-like domain-containing protein [Spirochaetota bacterium]|nr:Ig-like domain-containing protein [Spirochaetota bacterium]HRZ28194.1 Ig-like domain-containing protein [Spirochaetota bacterium]